MRGKFRVLSDVGGMYQSNHVSKGHHTGLTVKNWEMLCHWRGGGGGGALLVGLTLCLTFSGRRTNP